MKIVSKIFIQALSLFLITTLYSQQLSAQITSEQMLETLKNPSISHAQKLEQYDKFQFSIDKDILLQENINKELKLLLNSCEDCASSKLLYADGFLLSSARMLSVLNEFNTSNIYQKFQLYRNLGSSLNTEGRNTEALIYYQKCIEIDSNQLSSYINIGNIYFDRLEHDLAKHYYKKALEKLILFKSTPLSLEFNINNFSCEQRTWTPSIKRRKLPKSTSIFLHF